MSLALAMSAFLLELHETSNELGYRALHRFTLERLAALLPFDAGLLAMGTVQKGDPQSHDFVLDRLSPELMMGWDAVKHEDRVAGWAFTNPGKTGNFDTSGPIYEGLDGIRAHCQQWSLAHILCTCMIAPEAGLYWVMSLYRHDPLRPFTEEERAATELLVPHAFSAARRARLGELRARSRVTEMHGHAAAIAKPTGLVLEAEPAFVELLKLGWPRWAGPHLPAEITSEMAHQTTGRISRGPIVVRTDLADDLVLLHARRQVVADQLTAREREIATAFSQGETHREIGERLGLAANTVRRHLSNIYEKLGIASKVELDRMLSGLM